VSINVKIQGSGLGFWGNFYFTASDRAGPPAVIELAIYDAIPQTCQETGEVQFGQCSYRHVFCLKQIENQTFLFEETELPLSKALEIHAPRRVIDVSERG